MKKSFRRAEARHFDDEFKAYIRQAKQYPVLSAAEERVLFEKLQNARESGNAAEARELREKAVRHNMLFAVRKTLHFMSEKEKSGRPLEFLSFMDLLQEANTGLIIAVDKFDLAYGSKFSTYAAPWIEQRLKIAPKAMEDRIRLPVHIHDLLYKRGKIIRQFKKAGKSFTDDDIAAALNISRKSLEALKKARPHFVQPRTFTMEGEELNTLQEIADRDKGVLERLEIKGMAALADKIIGEDLDVREGFILREAIGKPGHCSPSNNQDIGNKLGISREAVRISRNAARKKVVARMQEHGLEACEIG